MTVHDRLSAERLSVTCTPITEERISMSTYPVMTPISTLTRERISMDTIASRPITPQQKSAWLTLLAYALTHESCRLWVGPLTRWLESEVG
jgi:hypothetical protein